MATDKSQPWFVEKRAQAYVSSLLSWHDVVVRDQNEQDYGVDLVIDLRKNGHETGRLLAVTLKGYVEYPSVVDLNKTISRQVKAPREELVLPFVAFVVQVKHLDARYAWISKPSVNGVAHLSAPIEYEWRELNDKAMGTILNEVSVFWEILLGRS